MPIQQRIQQERFDSASAQAVVSLIVAADHCTEEIGLLCARFGITGDQLNVLRILRGVHPHGHPRGEIATRLMRRSPDVTRMLDRLERNGLVARRSGDADRRLSVATITDGGLSLLAEIGPELDRLMADLTLRLTGEQCRELARLCDLMVP